MRLNEPDYVTVHTLINIMTAYGAKRAHKMRNNNSRLFSLINCYKRVTFIYHLLEKGYYKHTMRKVGVWLNVMYTFLLFLAT